MTTFFININKYQHARTSWERASCWSSTPEAQPAARITHNLDFVLQMQNIRCCSTDVLTFCPYCNSQVDRAVWTSKRSCFSPQAWDAFLLQDFIQVQVLPFFTSVNKTGSSQHFRKPTPVPAVSCCQWSTHPMMLLCRPLPSALRIATALAMLSCYTCVKICSIHCKCCILTAAFQMHLQNRTCRFYQITVICLVVQTKVTKC